MSQFFQLIYKYLMDNQEVNNRATNVITNTQDQERIQSILYEIQETQNKNVFYVLTKFIEVPEIKVQPDFIESLFAQNLEIVAQMIDWMLIPKSIIKSRKIKSNVDGYPYHSKEFMKDNWCFYQQLYIHIRNGKISLSIWFKFLTAQFYDPTTLHTALGYFSEVMIPFAKYEFSSSFNLTQSINLISVNPQTFGIMKIVQETILQEIIKYCHFGPIYQFLSTAILVSIQDPNDTQFSEKALLKLFSFAKKKITFDKEFDCEQVETHCEFLENLAVTLKQAINNIDPGNILSCRLLGLLKSLLDSGLIPYVMDMITSSKLCRRPALQFLTKSVSLDQVQRVNSNNSDDPLQSSMPISPVRIKSFDAKEQNQQITEGQEQFLQILLKILTYSVQIFIKIPKNIGSSPNMSQLALNSPLSRREPDFIQQKYSPSTSRKIKQKNSFNSSEEDELKLTGSNQQIRWSSAQKQGYNRVMIKFRQQMQQLLNNLQQMNFLVYQPFNPAGSSSGKTIKFSSGQNIKPITFMKFQYFKLLYSCLVMVHCIEIDNSQNIENVEKSQENQNQFVMKIQQNIEKMDLSSFQTSLKPLSSTQLPKMEVHVQLERKSSSSFSSQQFQNQKQQKVDQNLSESQKIKLTSNPTRSSDKKNKKSPSFRLQPFKFQIEKLYLIEVIQKYLNENRWNNIAHQILEKIFHLLVMRQYVYLRRKIHKENKNKKKNENFLTYLIENFTQRDYIFLDTFKFTTQGNLHSLYNISKDLAYTLNGSNQLVLLLNEFEAWKKFLMNDLNKYQAKTYPKITQPDLMDDQVEQDEKRSSYGLKVDEVDSIRKLIQNISVSKKWPQRVLKKRGDSKSAIFRKSDDQKQKSTDYMYMSHGASRKSNSELDEDKNKKTLDDLLKKKIQFSNDGDSQIRQFQVQDISVRDRLASTQYIKKEIKDREGRSKNSNIL